jgi:hypothetical protein
MIFSLAWKLSIKFLGSPINFFGRLVFQNPKLVSAVDKLRSKPMLAIKIGRAGHHVVQLPGLVCSDSEATLADLNFCLV